MKISHKILLFCLLFAISGIVLDKYFIHKKYQEYIRTGDIEDKMIGEDCNYKYLVIDGVNVARVFIRTKSNKSKIRYRNSETNNFSKYVKNDTLYIKFNEELRESNLRTHSSRNIHLNNNKLEYVDIKNADSKVNISNIQQLEINANYSANLNIYTKNVDSLKISVGKYSKANIKNFRKTTLPFLDVSVFENGIADIRKLEVNVIKKTKLDNGIILTEE